MTMRNSRTLEKSWSLYGCFLILNPLNEESSFILSHSASDEIESRFENDACKKRAALQQNCHEKSYWQMTS